MAKAEYSQTVDVPLEKFFDTIVGYENYPQFVEGCKKVEVERKAAGHAVVKYHVSMMKDLWYRLEQTEDRASGKMSWKLIDSDTLKSNVGEWTLKPGKNPNQTDIDYKLDIEFNIPVPGFILSKLVKGSLPAMVKSFEKFAKTGK
ncbi:MAG: hypothetical protein EOP09_12665 [Proteobacteria bacterium]|nr:MAG: hypothetical protein EOP09_12665 [Pseudomonadota bacterium]